MYLVLLGAPGSGKGTQGTRLAAKLGIPKVATGDLLRAAVRDATDLGKQAEAFMTKGLLVPDEIILGLIEEVVRSPAAAQGIIMDGFPRTVAQAEAVDRLLQEREAQVDRVLLIDVAKPELVRRVLGRAREEGRSDDVPETIEKRLDVYRAQTAPLISFFRHRGIVREIDGVGSVDEVAARMWLAVTA